MSIHASEGTNGASSISPERLSKPSISVITATFNCSKLLPNLIASLCAQTDPSFEWVVMDGASIDETVAIVNAAPLRRVVLDSRRDFGIYDALNRGIQACSGDFYLVLGADDVIESTAIERYKAAVAATNADIVVASVVGLGRVMRPMRGRRWLRGGNAIAASHAVGTLTRTGLHAQLGLYSGKFPSAADMHFLLRASQTPHIRIHAAHFLAGEFGSSGLSSVERLLSLCDAFRIQIDIGGNSLVQLLLLNLRIGRFFAERWNHSSHRVSKNQK